MEENMIHYSDESRFTDRSSDGERENKERGREGVGEERE